MIYIKKTGLEIIKDLCEKSGSTWKFGKFSDKRPNNSRKIYYSKQK